MAKNKFVKADPKLCIACSTCMAACYTSAIEREKLAAPRLIVKKTKKGTMPVQCNHCKGGPCVKACPKGALSFGEDCIEMNEELCIGCSLCVKACPFGAIRVEKLEGQKKRKAIKCDLCNGREMGPACVEVCPTKALKFFLP